MEDVIAAARCIEKLNEEQTETKVDQLVTAMQDQMQILQKNLKDATDGFAAATTTPAPAAATPVPPAAPPAAPTLHVYDYVDGMDYRRVPRRPPMRRPPQCYLCDEEGHFVTNCPARQEFQRLMHQQAHVGPRAPPQGRVLERPAPEDDPATSLNVQLN